MPCTPVAQYCTPYTLVASEQAFQLTLPRELLSRCLEPLLFSTDVENRVHSIHFGLSFAHDRLERLLAGAVDKRAAWEVRRILLETVGIATASGFRAFLECCLDNSDHEARTGPLHVCNMLVMPSLESEKDATSVIRRFSRLIGDFTALRVLEIDCIPVKLFDSAVAAIGSLRTLSALVLGGAETESWASDIMHVDGLEVALAGSRHRLRSLELVRWVGGDREPARIADLPVLKHIGFDRMWSCKRLLMALVHASPLLQSLSVGHDNYGAMDDDAVDRLDEAGEPVQLRVVDVRAAIQAIGPRLRSLRLRGESFARPFDDGRGYRLPVLDTLEACRQLRHLCVSEQGMVTGDALARFKMLECVVVQPHAGTAIDWVISMAWSMALSELAAEPGFRRLHFLEPDLPIYELWILLARRRPAYTPLLEVSCGDDFDWHGAIGVCDCEAR